MSDFDPRTTPWQIDESEFYEVDGRDAQLAFLLRYAVLAPSSHNTQPWSFAICDEGIAVRADYTRRLPLADPRDRELLMSVGAAIANLRVAAAHFGYETTVMYQARDEEDLPVATVTFRETCSPAPELARLFPAITARRTNRQPFEPRTIEDPALSALCDFMDEHGKTLHFIVTHDRERIAALIEEGDRTLMADPAFRTELARWIRPNVSSATDGICGDAFGIPGPISALGPWLMRQIDIGPAQARHDRALAQGAAGMIVVTAEDDRTSLIRAGESLERLLLMLTSLGISYSFLNQPVEVVALRGELWAMLRSPHPPQLLLRIGYAVRPVAKAMPRRSAESVVARTV